MNLDKVNFKDISNRKHSHLNPVSNKNHFMYGFNKYKLIWIFSMGCFAGTIIEMIFGLVKYGTLESRSSMVIGPFNLVYGLGALVLTVGIHYLSKRSYPRVFLMGILLGTGVEFICSFVQEKLFGTVSWDYSSSPLNLYGRVHLLYSVFWGVLAILWIKWIEPIIERYLDRIPDEIGRKIALFLVAFFILDTALSGMAVYRWTMRLDGVAAHGRLDIFLDTILPNSTMKVIYPNMIF